MLGVSSLYSNPMSTTLMSYVHPSSYCASSVLRTAYELTWQSNWGRLGHFRAAANLVKSLTYQQLLLYRLAQ